MSEKLHGKHSWTYVGPIGETTQTYFQPNCVDFRRSKALNRFRFYIAFFEFDREYGEKKEKQAKPRNGSLRGARPFGPSQDREASRLWREHDKRARLKLRIDLWKIKIQKFMIGLNQDLKYKPLQMM